jgi:hypothetical protein
MRRLLFKSVMSMWFLAMFCGTASVPGPAAAAEDQEWKLNFGGYLREHMSMNLQDHPETSQNDQFTLQMLRSAVQVEGDASKGDIRVHAVGRIVGEIKTDYLKRLENIGAGYGLGSNRWCGGKRIFSRRWTPCTDSTTRGAPSWKGRTKITANL